jgi:hypothetical protein
MADHHAQQNTLTTALEANQMSQLFRHASLNVELIV